MNNEVAKLIADARDCNRHLVRMKRRGAFEWVAQYRYNRDCAMRAARAANKLQA